MPELLWKRVLILLIASIVFIFGKNEAQPASEIEIFDLKSVGSSLGYFFRKEPAKACGVVLLVPSVSRLKGVAQPILNQMGIHYRDSIVINEDFYSAPSVSPSIVRQKRHSCNCFASIFIMSDNSFSHASVLPEQTPLLKTNTDYFFVISHKQLNQRYRDSKDFEMIKYAIFLEISGRIVISAQNQCLYCESSKPVVTDMNALFPDFTRNLHGRHFRVSILYPVTGVQMEKINGAWHPKRTGGGILRNLITTAEVLNFSFTLQLPTDGSNTGLKVNGTWNGITGDIIYGRADIGLPLGISLERLSVVEVCSAFEYVRMVYCHGPSTPIYSWKIIFSVFSSPVRTCIVASTVTAMLTMCYVNRVYCSEILKQASRVPSQRMIIIFILSSLLGQYRRFHVRPAHMVFLSTWLAFNIVISNLFLSNLFKSFTSPPTEATPRNFYELSLSHYDISMTYFGGVIFNFFRHSKPGSTAHRIFEKMTKKPYLDCVRDSQSPKHACISYEATINHLRQVKFSDKYGMSPIIVRQDAILQLPISFALKKLHPMSQSISKVAMTNFESGLSEYWRRVTTVELKIASRNGQNIADSTEDTFKISDAKQSKLTLKPLSGCLTLYVIGIGVSTFVLMGEYSFDFVLKKVFTS